MVVQCRRQADGRLFARAQRLLTAKQLSLEDFGVGPDRAAEGARSRS